MEYAKEDIKTIETLRKEIERSAKRKYLKTIFISIAAAIVILVLAVLIISHQGKRIDEMDNRIKELANQPVLTDSIAPEISLKVIDTKIKEIGELATMEYLYTNMAKFTDSKQIKNWNIPFTEKSFTLQWDGVIKAGIDINKVTTALDFSKETLTIYLPPAKILSHDTKEESVVVTDESNGLFNSVKIEDKVNFDAENIKAMEDRAIENGLLEKAQANAETVILRLLYDIPGVTESYNIEFKVVE